jgi:hypothetical protein
VNSAAALREIPDEEKTMLRAKLALASALGLLLLSTAALTRSATAGYSYGFDNDDSSRLRWALIDGDRNSTSLSDPDDLDELKSRYGKSFLYIHDGEERYVIKDRGMMVRARDAMKPVQEAGKEIGKAVGEKVSYSMRRSESSRERARLARRLSRIESRISRLSDRGEDTDELENERQEIQQELDAMKNSRRVEHDAEERQADLDAATERASRHMREATRKMDQTMRDILKESKSRHLAEPVE